MPKLIDVLLTPYEFAAFQFMGKIALIIDVLRATSTITTAFANGCRAIMPVKSPEAAFEISKQLNDPHVLKAGEMFCRDIPGFDLSNRPQDHQNHTPGTRLIMKTTNGTVATLAAREADAVISTSFLNIYTVIKFLKMTERDSVIVLSGTEGAFSQDDALCGGMLIKHLENDNKTDAAKICEALYMRYKDNIYQGLADSSHGKRLIALGQDEDLRFCSQVQVYDVLPTLCDSWIVDGKK